MFDRTVITAAVLAVGMSGAAMAESACKPPADFKNPEPPKPVMSELFSHTEEVFVDAPLAVVHKAIAELELEDQTYRGMSLPSISGTHTVKTGKKVGEETSPGLPNMRTLACFNDGSWVLEEPIEVRQGENDFRYHYVVWNYTSDAFSAVDYGVADIRYIETPGKNTVISWTYSFKPNTKKHPQYAGAEGETKFRQDFLEGPFAELLRGSLAIWKVRSEAAK